jgi:hypothetical protein
MTMGKGRKEAQREKKEEVNEESGKAGRQESAFPAFLLSSFNHS